MTEKPQWKHYRVSVNLLKFRLKNEQTSTNERENMNRTMFPLLDRLRLENFHRTTFQQNCHLKLHTKEKFAMEKSGVRR